MGKGHVGGNFSFYPKPLGEQLMSAWPFVGATGEFVGCVGASIFHKATTHNGKRLKNLEKNWKSWVPFGEYPKYTIPTNIPPKTMGLKNGCIGQYGVMVLGTTCIEKVGV